MKTSDVELMACTAHLAPLSMGFSRQESWSGLPFPSPGDLPNPGMEPRSPALQADSLPAEPQGKPLVCAENAIHSLIMLGQDFIPAVQARIKKVHSEK